LIYNSSLLVALYHVTRSTKVTIQLTILNDTETPCGKVEQIKKDDEPKIIPTEEPPKISQDKEEKEAGRVTQEQLNLLGNRISTLLRP
jgi:hypothetical protein